jgi:hypothetical protein
LQLARLKNELPLNVGHGEVLFLALEIEMGAGQHDHAHGQAVQIVRYLVAGVVLFERRALAIGLAGDGDYATLNGLDISPDSNTTERASYGDVLLIERVQSAIARLNPSLKRVNMRGQGAEAVAIRICREVYRLNAGVPTGNYIRQY